MAKRVNRTDLTLRNLHALHKKLDRQVLRLARESARKAALSDVLWLDRRVAKLERDAARRRNG